MRARLLSIILPAAMSLVGCVTNPDYVQLRPGVDLISANAECELRSMAIGGSMLAVGSPEYVAGAQLGHAIATDMQRIQFKKNCMALLGWLEVPDGEGVSVDDVVAIRTGAQPSRPGFPPAPEKPPRSR